MSCLFIVPFCFLIVVYLIFLIFWTNQMIMRIFWKNLISKSVLTQFVWKKLMLDKSGDFEHFFKNLSSVKKMFSSLCTVKKTFSSLCAVKKTFSSLNLKLLNFLKICSGSTHMSRKSKISKSTFHIENGSKH